MGLVAIVAGLFLTWEYPWYVAFFMGLMLSRLIAMVLGFSNGANLIMTAFGGTAAVFSARRPEKDSANEDAAAVISVGEGNSYKHPSPWVVDRLRQAGAAILRTDLDGDIRILTDGGEPEVTVFAR